jgi:hypothetical protein
MRWYADNSELNGIRDADIPDMLIFGGVLVPLNSELDLINAIEGVKAKYGYARVPIKWNFKDLKRTYARDGLSDLYSNLLKSSKEWRNDIFQVVNEFDISIIISCIQSHSVQRKVISNVKTELTKYSFANSLMRVALHAQEFKPERIQIVLDWPDKGDSSPFDEEYASAYNFGQTSDRRNNYFSGPLKQLGFLDSAVYTNMTHSTLLQFADLVVGANREVIECAIGKKEDGFGLEMAKVIANKYRGYNQNEIYGKGIVVASGDKTFKDNIKNFIEENLQS